MKTLTIGPAFAACAAAAAVSGCAARGPHPVKLTAVQTPSSPVAKADLYYSAAVRAIEARDYALALDQLQAARSLSPDDVRVINAFGVVYDKLGRFDLSHRYYAQAQAIEPASRIVAGNRAYSERLQGLSHEPLAFASAADVHAKAEDGSMPGSPVVIVPIATTASLAVMAPKDAAPNLSRPTKPALPIAGPVPAVKAAFAQVARVERVSAKPAAVSFRRAPGKPGPVAASTLSRPPAKLAGAPILLIDQSGSPDAAQRLGRRLAKLGWSVQLASGPRGRPVEASRIDYPTHTPQIAHALARTLPGAVPVRVCAANCPAIRLVVGRDARLWAQPRKAVKS